MQLPMIRPDLAQHAIYGTVAACAGAIAAHLAGLPVYEQADVLITGVRISVAPDGTLTAV